MANLFQNPLFWLNQADFVVDKMKPNIFVGVGIATKDQISKAVPFDILGFLLSAEFVKRQIPGSQIFLLIADQHAWLANKFDRGESQKAADKLQTIVEKVIKNLKLDNWQVFLASKIFLDALPQSYEELEKRDVTHFFTSHNCGIKIGWSFSMAETEHKTDESHFDMNLNLPIKLLLTKPGVTNNPNKPMESPYICTDPAARITLDKLSTSKVESNKAVQNHLKRITILFEQLIKRFPNKTPLENKIKEIINLICR